MRCGGSRTRPGQEFPIDLGERPAASDGDGQFRVRHLASAAYGLRVSAAGWVTKETDVDLTSGVGQELLITLERGAALAGVVTDEETGAPIEAARVAAAEEQTATDGEGRFALSSLPPGPWRVEAGAAGYEPSAVEAASAGQDLAIALRREPTGGVRTRALARATGQPAPAARAFLRPAPGPGPSFQAGAGEDGAIALDAVRPGQYELVVHATGFAPATRAGVTVAAGAVAELGEMHLEPGAVARGRVLTPRGRPVPGARVYLAEWERVGSDLGVALVPQAWTGAEGTFELTGLPPGAHALEIQPTTSRIDDRFIPLKPATAAAGPSIEVTLPYDQAAWVAAGGDANKTPEE